MTKIEPFFEYILTHYRGIFATIFLLPVSAVYVPYTNLRNWVAFRLSSAPEKHDARVEAVIRQIEDWKAHGAAHVAGKVRHRTCGLSGLYARTTMSRTDFRKMFDHTGYDRLRERLPYCRQAFDEVCDKVSSKARCAPVEMRKLEKAS